MLNRFLSLCATNYHLLMQLLPEMEEQDSCTFSARDTDAPAVGDIRLCILGRHPYTTKIRVSARGLATPHWLPSPSLTLHACHDMGITEVVAWNGRAIKYAHGGASVAEEKLCVNRYLGECLCLCLQRAASPKTLLSRPQD